MGNYKFFEDDVSFAHICGEESGNAAYIKGICIEYELYLLVRGRANVVIEGHSYKIENSNAAFFSPGQYREIDIDANEPAEYYSVKFSPYIVPAELFDEIETASGCYFVNPDMISFFKKLDYHIDNYKGKHISGFFKCGFHEILYYFFDGCVRKNSSVENALVNKVIKYINDNLTRDFTLNEMCRSFKYSESYICGKVKKYISTPIMRYVKIKRVLLSASLIARGEKPNYIYKKCGFADYSTFYRSYKSILDRIPSSK